MSQEKLFKTLISSLEEKELYKLARLYLTEVEGVENVIITNGPWDSGVDLAGKNFESQYQATIQEKGFEDKLDKDLTKAKNNVDKFNLPNRVKYFYSFPLSNSTIFSLQKLSKQKFGIFLEIIEANKLAQIAVQYNALSDLLVSLNDLPKYQGESNFFKDSKVKAFYDLMSFGKSTDIKYSIVKCFVLNCILNTSRISKTQLLENLNQHFNSKINPDYFENFLRRLVFENKIRYTGIHIELTENEANRIHDVLENYKIEEAVLIRGVTEALTQVNNSANVDQIIIKLAQIYESNYSINMGEFTNRDSNITDFQSATNNLKTLLSSHCQKETDIDKLIKVLMTITDKSEILSRIAAGEVFSKVNDPERLEEYITKNINNKDIFLDTNIIIYALCVHYEHDADYDDYKYTIVKQLLTFVQENNLNLKTIRRYAIETTNYLKEALSIIPFTRLPKFESLGVSKNIFYKFYLHLKDNSLLREGITSFEAFLKEFKFHFGQGKNDSAFKSSMEFLLRSLQIEIEDIPDYYTAKTCNMIIEDLKMSGKKPKSHSAVLNDAIMFLRLGDPNVDINPIEPIFCTSDLSLIRARKVFFETFPNCTKWFMFTPTRLMDHFSMMNFRIKPGTVSTDVLAILDQDYSFQQMTHSLLDSILIIINPNNEVGLRYTNKLAELREKEILEVDNRPESFQDFGTEKTSIDLIFFTLFSNYITQKDQSRLTSFKLLFTQEQYFDDIFSLIAEEKKYVLEHSKTSDNLIAKMDEIIEKSKKTSLE